MKIQMLRWHKVCADCGKEFGLNIEKADRRKQRKGHKVEYRFYVWESEDL